MGLPEFMQVIPCEQAGVVAIVKTQPHSVVTHWFYLVDFHVELANLQHFLALAMAAPIRLMPL